MRSKRPMPPKPLLGILGAIVLTASCGHEPITQLVGTTNWHPDRDHAQVLTDEETKGNGIEVGAPKIYDDASLRMMLDATRAKLATMSGLNQDALISRLGSVSGATIDQTQFGFQVSGPTPPSVATTNTGPTNSVTTNGNLPQGNSSLPGTVTVATNPTSSSVITSAAPAAPPTVSPGIAFTPPTSVSPSSLDVLNEQMQLSYEMTNLALLLEGALSDRFVTNQRFIKPRVTLGFPISLRAPPQFKDAVAVVEVEVTTSPRNLSDPTVPEPPAITALLPREKTYNVAAMTDNMTSIGAGAVIGSVGVNASYLKGHKTLYLVQDQDTLAMQRPPPKDHNSTSFLWEFHPVLGQHYVRGGMKQTFVQLALPILEAVDCYGTIQIRTYWRRFDQKNGIAGKIIPESVLVSSKPFPIPRYDLAPIVGAIDYQDLGDGTLLVTVQGDGNYLAGTYVQLGPTRYEAGKNLLVEDTGVKFVASAAALSQWTGTIVARSGKASDLLNPSVQQPLHALHQTVCTSAPAPAPPRQTECLDASPAVPRPHCPNSLNIAKVAVQPLNETDSLLRVDVSTTMIPQNEEKLLLVIGTKVFGLRDAPVRREPVASGMAITVTVPTALLIANPRVRVFLPFWSDMSATGQHCYADTYRLDQKFAPGSAVEHLVLVSVDPSGEALYLLYGNGLDKAEVLVPEHGAALEALDNMSQDHIRLLRIKKAALQASKKIVLQKNDSQPPLVLDLPDVKPAATPAKISIDSPVIQNTDEVDVSVDNAADVTTVKLKDKTLHWKPVGKSTIRLLTLKADGVTTAQSSPEITIEYKGGGKDTLKFDVVAARVSVKTM
jgi:hypothetical protein